MANLESDDLVFDLSDSDVKALEDAYGIVSAPEPVVAKAKVETTPSKAAEAAPAKVEDNALLKRLRDAEERAASERAKRIEAERLAHERGTTVAISHARAAESDHTAVANALTRAESDRDSLKVAHQAALEAGDYAKATEAAEKMATVAARISQLADGKAALEDKVRSTRSQAEAAIKTEPPKQEAQSDPFEQFLTTSNLPPKAQAWFRAHPECAPTTDKAQYYKALAAHETVVKGGAKEGSDEYFDKLDEAMGFNVAETSKTTDAEVTDDVVVDTKATPPAPKAAPRVSAPVSRDSSILHKRADGKMQIRLTKAQAEMAEAMGMTPSAYGKRLLEAEQQGLLGRGS